MISCTDAVQQLWDYVEHNLAENERDRVEEHLALCRRCCGELEFAEELRTFMARRPTVDVPPEIHERLERLIVSLDGGAP